MSDLYIQEWHTKVASSSKGKTYYLFKHDVHFENYLTKLTKKHYSTLLKFRLSNHRLPVETGRWENIPLGERKCNLCEKVILVTNFIIFLYVIISKWKHFFKTVFLQKSQYY